MTGLSAREIVDRLTQLDLRDDCLILVDELDGAVVARCVTHDDVIPL